MRRHRVPLALIGLPLPGAPSSSRLKTYFKHQRVVFDEPNAVGIYFETSYDYTAWSEMARNVTKNRFFGTGKNKDHHIARQNGNIKSLI
ncbi:uncharacterized protein METZ01_LOCUS20498 [marine metagenome]|uniref:Uncharacterized protein n=1 Tax=marine metagenome TaxID=408172 RepID=A0A381PM02_9ZZZZ